MLRFDHLAPPTLGLSQGKEMLRWLEAQALFRDFSSILAPEYAEGDSLLYPQRPCTFPLVPDSVMDLLTPAHHEYFSYAWQEEI